jgi:hypothetical protein
MPLSEHGYALVAQMHPALNFRGGTANLLKALCSYPGHPFSAVVSADMAGPDPLPGPWDEIPTLPLFRPRSMFPKLKIGLGLLDNLAYRLQRRRMARFLKKQKVKRLFVIITNSTRFARLAGRLPESIPMDLYVIDDPVADAGLYRMDETKAQQTYDGLIARSDRIFAISPVYAKDIEEKYKRPCRFLPILIRDSILKAPAAAGTADAGPGESGGTRITIHHAGQIHHLYADAVARLIPLLGDIADRRNAAITLEFWGNLEAWNIEKILGLTFKGENQCRLGRLTVKLCGEVTLEQLTLEQKRADFLLLVNSFLPELERQIRCSFSSKVCEYMVSGVPILLFVPHYSSLVPYLGEKEAAHMVTAADNEEADRQLKVVLFDPDRQRTVEPARSLALDNHTSETFFERLLSTASNR